MEITEDLNGLVFRLARRYIKDDLHQDCAQEVLYKLWRHAEFATEGMIVMMLRYWFLKLRRDMYDNIEDHQNELTIELDDSVWDVSDLKWIRWQKGINGKEKLFIKLVLEEVQISNALKVAGINWKEYQKFLNKCREAIDKRESEVLSYSH